MLQTKTPQPKKASSTPGRPTGQAKPSATSGTTAQKDIARAAVSAEERYRRVAEAAYFRALARGFNGGDPLEDWLAAEQEINRTLSGPAAPPGARPAS